MGNTKQIATITSTFISNTTIWQLNKTLARVHKARYYTQ